jgi:hypothetical protein
MAKKPAKVDKSATIERTVFVPGWGYNYVIERAQRERRTAKDELSLILERALRAEMAAEGKEPGNKKPATIRLAA